MPAGGSSSSAQNGKVSALSMPTATTAAATAPPTPSSRRGHSRSINTMKSSGGDDDGAPELGGGPIFSIKSFRRKKYIRQRLSPLEDGNQSQQLTPRPATTGALGGASSRVNAKAHVQGQHNGSPDSQDDANEEDDEEEIARLQRFHASLSSDDKIKRWIATYENEKQQFASFAVFTETKLDEIQDAYVTIMGRPNAVEVAACFASLVKMPGIVGCYTSLLEKLAVGIHSAIYCPSPHDESMDSSEAASSLVPTTAAVSSQQPMATLVQGFFDRKTYFARTSELEKQLFANRCINDARVLRSLTEDEVTRFFIQVPIRQLEIGLTQLAAYAVSSSNKTKFDELFSFMKKQHAEQKRLQLHVQKSILEDEDDAYPFFISLASSAQICRAIAHSAASFSASGKEMILCSILEFLDVDSFKDIFKRFDAHSKALFLHHLSVMESSDHLQCIVEQLPNAGEMLFRFYLVSCGTQGDPTNLTKQVFFKKILGAEMEYFFLYDLAAYLNEEQYLLLSKEYEKNVLVRKRQRRARRSSAMPNGDGQEFDDDFDDEDKDEGSVGGARQRPVKSSIENFQLMIWNFLHHHRLSSAQVLSIIATVLLPSLEEKERAVLIDYCLENFLLDGRWSQVLRIVDETEAEHNTSLLVAGSMVVRSSDSNNNGMDKVTANVHETRIKLLKKLFAMLSREERESWLDNMNAKYLTEALKKKIQSLKLEASKTTVVMAAPQPIPQAVSLDDPKAHIPQMKMELKMLWMECLLEAITNDKEYSARMTMLRQVLQPFLDGKLPSQGDAQAKVSIVTIEKSISQLLGQLPAADKAKLLLKLAPPQLHEENPRVDRATSPIPELKEEPPAPPPPQPVLPTANPEILSAFQTLLVCKPEERVLQILRNALLVDENASPPPQAAPAENIDKHAHALTSEMKRKLSAVVAVAEPMEWQEYVKLGSVDVGCQTTFDPSEVVPAAPIEPPAPLAISTNSTLARSSVLPNKLAPLTLSTLLGKVAGGASPRKKENKYQKINSAAVPRSIGGLVTSWRMNTDQLVQFTKKSLSVVLKIIADAYGEMLTAGRRKTNLPYAPMRGRELSLAQVVYQQFLHSYGLPGIADMHLLAFSCAIEMYRTQHLRVEYFARYCFEEVPKTELANYLEFLECIVCDDVNVTGGAITKGQQQSQQQQVPSKRLRGGFVPRIVVLDRENWTIGVDKAQEAAHLCFRAMRKNSVVAFCDRLVAIAAMGSTSSIVSSDPSNSVASNQGPSPSTQTPSELVINVDHLLQLVSYEWRDEQLRRDNHLLDAFRAGDMNGDGQLTSAEFSQIVLSIDHARDLGDILLMYSETLRRTECDHINTEVFLQVAKEYELDRVVWNEDGDLRNIVNDISDLDKTWRNIRCFFLGTLEALSRDLLSNHFLRVCEGAGCGCLKCILDGYIGFQRMRRDFAMAGQEQTQQREQGDLVVRSPYAVSESLVWARYWHLMRQIYEAAAESDGILTPWEGSDYIRIEPAPPMQPRFVTNRRNALPNILFPDTNRISAKMSAMHDPEVFDADTINAQFASLLDHMVYKKPDATDSTL